MFAVNWSCRALSETLHLPQHHMSRSAARFMYAYSCSSGISDMLTAACLCILALASTYLLCSSMHCRSSPPRPYNIVISINMLKLFWELSWLKYYINCFNGNIWIIFQHRGTILTASSSGGKLIISNVITYTIQDCTYYKISYINNKLSMKCSHPHFTTEN